MANTEQSRPNTYRAFWAVFPCVALGLACYAGWTLWDERKASRPVYNYNAYRDSVQLAGGHEGAIVSVHLRSDAEQVAMVPKVVSGFLDQCTEDAVVLKTVRADGDGAKTLETVIVPTEWIRYVTVRQPLKDEQPAD